MAPRESSHRQRFNLSGSTAVGEALAAARQYAVDQRLSDRDRARLCIIVEELIANLCEHGVCDATHEITLELGRQASDITILIEDNGQPFDPRSAPDDPEVAGRGGGAGLRLVKAWSEIVSYEVSDGRNQLHLIMSLGAG